MTFATARCVCHGARHHAISRPRSVEGSRGRCVTGRRAAAAKAARAAPRRVQASGSHPHTSADEYSKAGLEYLEESGESLRGVPVLVRVDAGVVTDMGSFKESLLTIEWLAQRGAKVLVCGAYGAKGPDAPTLAPVAKKLSSFAGESGIEFAHDCVGDVVGKALGMLQDGGVCVLENLNRHAEEDEANDVHFAQALAEHVTHFVNDDLSLDDVPTASTVGIVPYVTHAVAGRRLAAWPGLAWPPPGVKALDDLPVHA